MKFEHCLLSLRQTLILLLDHRKDLSLRDAFLEFPSIHFLFVLLVSKPKVNATYQLIPEQSTKGMMFKVYVARKPCSRSIILLTSASFRPSVIYSLLIVSLYLFHTSGLIPFCRIRGRAGGSMMRVGELCRGLRERPASGE